MIINNKKGTKLQDIIKLLPDHVANQIAAGEVVQRPASVVKELMENAIDAGCREVTLVIKDAGKTLIQVIDNGCGMSDTDARMSFERHATSKIREAHELFAIRTMGFRGEALASIASVSMCEMKTRRHDDELGTHIEMKGSEVISQQNCACNPGTQITVKNLFFNTPARRKFLKSDSSEMSHIQEEFFRIALSHPDISFLFFEGSVKKFHLEPAGLKQRIAALHGANYNQRLLEVEEKTSILNISGYVARPEFARKTRGEQYLFVNHRYIKHAYLNNAVFRAYENMIPADHFPSYFLFITIDPSHIDVNIHPTKTEIKFEDERAVYQIVHAAVKMSLGKFHLAPMLDFETEPSMDFSKLDPERPVVQPKITVNPNYNPFDKEITTQKKPENWQKLFLQSDIPEMLPDENSEQKVISPEWKDENLQEDAHKPYSVHGKYIVTHIRSGLLIIDQHRAHTRILFEKIISNITAQKIASQQLLFPETMHLNAVDYDILKDLMVNLQSFGFELGDLGNGSIALYGVPSGIEADSPVKLIEEIIEDYKNHLQDSFSGALERMAASVASASSVKYGKTLSPQEMLFLIDELFACSNPNYTPGGKNIHFIVNIEEWDDRFGKIK